MARSGVQNIRFWCFIAVTTLVGIPQTYAASSGVIALGAGEYHTVALKADGAAIAWGRNTAGQTTVPAGAEADVIAVAGGGYHSLALKTDGSLVAWGDDTYGQTTGPTGAGAGFIAFAAGSAHTVALKSDGSVVAWGIDDNGQVTVPAGAGANVIAVAAGNAHTVALKSDGSLVAWGNDGDGQVTGPAGAGTGFIAIAAGDSHTVALKSDGSVVAWGNDGNGQVTVPPGAAANVIAVAAGSAHTVALKSDGSVVAWGNDDNGQATVPPGAGANVIAIAASGNHSAALKSDGSVVAWGADADGQSTVPQIDSAGVIAAAAGFTHTVALKSDGSVVAWGNNGDGQATVSPSASSAVSALAPGGYHTVVLKSDGSVVAWGKNNLGQTTVPAAAGSDVTAVAAGLMHTAALKSNGSVLVWGNPAYGLTTVPAGAGSGVVALAAGAYHIVALKSDGSVIGWGSDNQNQTTVPSSANSGVVAISAGYYHTVALKDDGSVIAWGGNNDGQITVPSAATAGVIAVSAGGYHTVALKSDGSVVAWGATNVANDYGQATVPPAAGSGVIAVSAGGYHTVALKSDGSVIGWGNDDFGQATVANFTVTVSPSGGVSVGAFVAVEGSAGLIDCLWDGVTATGTCVSGDILATTKVVLTAELPPGTVVGSWGAGCDATTATTCTIDSLAADTIISPVFDATTYNVTAAAGANGSLDTAYRPSPQTVVHGGTTSFKFDANAGYHVASVGGCGISYSNSSAGIVTYTATTAAVTGDCGVSATFALHAPGTVTLVAPAGVIVTATPTYTWNALPGADSYQLWVGSGPTTVISVWYTAGDAGCASGTGTCSVTPATALAAQKWSFNVKARNVVGTGPWTTAQIFTYTVPFMPTAITLVSPTGVVGSATPTYTWSAMPTVASYQLWVGMGATTVISQWYTAAQAGCGSGTGTCSVTPATALAQGKWAFNVKGQNVVGTGPWTVAKNFTYTTATTPTALTLVSPAGVIPMVAPTYTWIAMANVDTYLLYVGDGKSSTPIYQWYTAAAAGCASGEPTCSVTPATALTEGVWYFNVKGQNLAGTSPWATSKMFIYTNATLPTTLTLQSPSGAIGTNTPTYTWDALAGVDSYLLYVGGATTAVYQWYTAAAAGCASGEPVCSVTPSTVLATGTWYFNVRGKNLAGTGPWAASKRFVVP